MKPMQIGSALSLVAIALFATGVQGQPGYSVAPANAELHGRIGPAGATGATGLQDGIDQTPAPGSGSTSVRWTPYMDFWFHSDGSDMQSSDSVKVRDIVSYLQQNPGQQVGIDGSMGLGDRDLNNRRVASVRNALVLAGVPTYQIQIGAFSEPQAQRESRVSVLVRKR